MYRPLTFIWTSPDLAIYAGRPLIYGLLAAIDPVGCITLRHPFFFMYRICAILIARSSQSFTRAMHALRHPESDSETGANHSSRSAQGAVPLGCLSTVIIETPPDESVLGEFDKDFREHSQIMASTSTLGTPEQYPSTQRGQIQIATNAANNQEVSFIDVVCHI